MKHRSAIWPRLYWVPLANAVTYALIGLIVTYALVGVIVNNLRQPVNHAKRSRQPQAASSGKTAFHALFI
jgi:hypothetical protein